MAIHIDMPKLSDTMTEGTIIKWLKKPGDTIEMGDIIAEVETDKATMEMEAFEDGVIRELVVAEGGKAAVGTVIMLLEGEGNDETPAAAAPAKKEPAAGKKSAPAPAPAKGSIPPAPAAAEASRVKASPLARKIARERGVDLSRLKGTGPSGRIVATDVENAGPAAPAKAAAAPRPAGPAVGEERTLPLTGMRRVIAQRLVESKTQIPHFYLNMDVDAGPLLAVRAQLKEQGESLGVSKLTINDFVLRAVALAAMRVPRINARFTEDAIIEYGSVHLSVAVSIEDGLITPVIRDAQSKSLAQISTEMKDLAARARNKKLKPEEYQGGTISISNLGAQGIHSFYAILNPPQAAIIAVGAIVRKPVVSAAGDIVAGHVMNLGVSGDHRVADGAVAADFLVELKKLVENPAVLLV